MGHPARGLLFGPSEKEADVSAQAADAQRGSETQAAGNENCREDLDSISVPTGLSLSAFRGRVYTASGEFADFGLSWPASAAAQEGRRGG